MLSALRTCCWVFCMTSSALLSLMSSVLFHIFVSFFNNNELLRGEWELKNTVSTSTSSREKKWRKKTGYEHCLQHRSGWCRFLCWIQFKFAFDSTGRGRRRGSRRRRRRRRRPWIGLSAKCDRRACVDKLNVVHDFIQTRETIIIDLPKVVRACRGALMQPRKIRCALRTQPQSLVAGQRRCPGLILHYLRLLDD